LRFTNSINGDGKNLIELPYRNLSIEDEKSILMNVRSIPVEMMLQLFLTSGKKPGSCHA
jgi:hypothetical protein